MMIGKEKIVEYRVIDDEQLPPIVITMDENDEVKLIINLYHKVWLMLNRKTIGGVTEGLFEKITNVLDAHLLEQRQYELLESE